MELVLQVETSVLQKVKDILLKDDLVSRASIVFKDAKLFGKNGYFCYIYGSEEQCKKAEELTKELAKKIEKTEKEEIINKIKDEENKASEAFGGIFP